MDLRFLCCSELPAARAREIEALEKRLFSKADSWAGGVQQEVSRRNTFLLYAEAMSPGEQKGMVIGYVVFSVNSIVVHVAKIAVAPEHQRRGVGTALLRACLGKAVRERRALCATLHVGVANAPAIALYRRAGFGADATLPDYYSPGRDALKMACDLTSVRARAFLQLQPTGGGGSGEAAAGDDAAGPAAAARR